MGTILTTTTTTTTTTITVTAITTTTTITITSHACTAAVVVPLVPRASTEPHHSTTTTRDTEAITTITSTQETTTTTIMDTATPAMALAHTTTKDFFNLIPDNGTGPWILPTDIWHSVSDIYIAEDDSHRGPANAVVYTADSFTKPLDSSQYPTAGAAASKEDGQGMIHLLIYWAILYMNSLFL